MPVLFSRNKFLAFHLSVISILLLSCSPKTAPSSGSASINDMRIDQAILDYVNEYRQGKGLPALQLDPIISAEAEKHSSNMANKKTAFGHDGFENRIKAISQKIETLHASAENVAYGKISAKQVVDIWLKSPGHRKNIEGTYALTGINVARSNDGNIFFTEIFGRK